MSSFFQELKQRRIVQIAASYAVSGWVALEVVGALVERGIMPELAYRVGLVVYLGGLAVALITGWYHGEKGHQKATRSEVALLSVVAVATLFFSVQTVRNSRAAALAVDAGTSGSLNLSRVAVLYFRDQSRDGELGYLADGLTEGLLERMEGVPGLNPISQSGSEQYRGTDLPRDSVATLLSAGTLVEGSVEPRGDQIRVTVALYDGEAGTEINRQSLDRPADDLFALQEEVSQEVTDLLRTWLGAEISLREARRGTENVGAWTDLRRGLRARRSAEERYQEGDLEGFIADFGRADSLFAAAEEADPEWAEPTVWRAFLASRWGDLSVDSDPGEAAAYMELARQRAGGALAKEPRSAQALAVRGNTEYLVWLLGLSPTPAASDAAFEEALSSLQAAVTENPDLAGAWNTLSVLYSQVPDLVEANLAARRALEADEFLRNASDVLRRLYATSYDLEQFREAIQYCEQGHTRFPDEPDFTECRLWLMAAPRGLAPEPDEAWRTLDEHLALLPASERARAEVQDRLVVAAVLARAELPDSARAVIAATEVSVEVDPERELLGVEALAHLALGDPVAAVDRLKVYLTASPEHRAGWRWTSHWWWRPLQDDPEFRRLVGG